MIAVLYFAILAAIYAGLYYCNHKTPVPKGCEDAKAKCSGCKNWGCEMQSSQKEARKDETE